MSRISGRHTALSLGLLGLTGLGLVGCAGGAGEQSVAEACAAIMDTRTQKIAEVEKNMAEVQEDPARATALVNDTIDALDREIAALGNAEVRQSADTFTNAMRNLANFFDTAQASPSPDDETKYNSLTMELEAADQALNDLCG
ncbi:hypothetical protein [Mycetocola spongiae]|uniref:hypothetical protein n=1 Tax=Mycetocola spongiae TaxID=2859226 RepID=UPI001CF16A29|nr:hypothetical protein [Mycetocola spongiae]UCR88695.1 hypothetical protein KXZ72_12125 [Mycetocola spongiae]